MKYYEVRTTVDVEVTLVVHAPDEERAEHWYDLPQQSVLVRYIDVNWNRPWDVADFEDEAFIPYTEKDVRASLEPIVSELRTNAFLRDEPQRDTAVTVEFIGDSK